MFNDGQWTAARFHSFIKGALRQASLRWPPKHEVKKEARVERGKYICAVCKEITRAKDIHVDHIEPVIDPAIGFVSWDEAIERMFCDSKKLQVVCTCCHKEITANERAISKERKRKEQGV